jgi:hypothetical protein
VKVSDFRESELALGIPSPYVESPIPGQPDGMVPTRCEFDKRRDGDPGWLVDCLLVGYLPQLAMSVVSPGPQFSR